MLVRWNVLDARGRSFAIAGLAIVMVLVLLGGIAQRDTRVVLFATPLRSEQVVEVVERLAEWNTPFVSGTDNVRVDAALRNGLLMRLSLAGVPHAHLASSVEALAKAGPLTPQSVLDAQQRDGLAGDIAAGLRDIADIADARVIIAPAREGAFADEARHEATASVRLSLKPGATPSREAIDGVRQYVAAAVPGLDPKRVAILDDRGLALGDDARSPVGEAHVLEGSLQSALDLALGAGVTIVRVHVNYDPRARALHDIVRKPIGSRAIGTTTVDEHYKSASKQYAKSNSSLDRGSEVHDETIETPAGRLERISVAVAVDQSRHLQRRCAVNLDRVRPKVPGDRHSPSDPAWTAAPLVTVSTLRTRPDAVPPRAPPRARVPRATSRAPVPTTSSVPCSSVSVSAWTVLPANTVKPPTTDKPTVMVPKSKLPLNAVLPTNFSADAPPGPVPGPMMV